MSKPNWPIWIPIRKTFGFQVLKVYCLRLKSLLQSTMLGEIYKIVSWSTFLTKYIYKALTRQESNALKYECMWLYKIIISCEISSLMLLKMNLPMRTLMTDPTWYKIKLLSCPKSFVIAVVMKHLFCECNRTFGTT